MTISKKELRSLFLNLHPLDVGLVFKVYKKSNYNDIQFDKIYSKRSKYIKKGLNFINSQVRIQKNNKIRVKYSEFIKYLAENLFDMNIKDLGYLKSSELREIFQYIKENELSIYKIYNQHKLEGFLFSILKVHIIYILESSILLSEIIEIKAQIEDLSSLILYSEINIEDLFHNMNTDELIQVFNLICYFSDLKGKIILDESLDNLLEKLLNISKTKIKNHINILLQYSLKMTEIIGHPNQYRWISLLNSEDIVIFNEDLILYFVLKSYNGHCNDQFRQAMQIIRFNFLSDPAKHVYNRFQSSILNLSNLSRNKYFSNNTLTSKVVKRSEMNVLNNLPDNTQLPSHNKHIIIDKNLNVNGCFSYEIQILNKNNLRFKVNIDDLVKTWNLYLGFSIKTDKKINHFVFDLFSLICENSSKNDVQKFFSCRSILRSSKFDNILRNMSKSTVPPAPAVFIEEENYMQGELSMHEEGISLIDNDENEILRDDNRVTFALNWNEGFILVEIGGLFSVYIEIHKSFLVENVLETRNELIFPIISYNDEYFNIMINNFSRNLKLRDLQIIPKERQNTACNQRIIGSKTRRKVLTDVSKKQSGAPKRVTRLRPSGSTNIAIPFAIDSLNSFTLSASSPTNRRGRPRKNTSQTFIGEIADMNNMKQHCSSSTMEVSKKNENRNISQSTKARSSNSLVIKKINKKIKACTNNNCYFNSLFGRFFANSLNKLISFFRNCLL